MLMTKKDFTDLLTKTCDYKQGDVNPERSEGVASERSEGVSLPESWLSIREKVVPYVAKAYRFARSVIAEDDRIWGCHHREFKDCYLTAKTHRPTDDRIGGELFATIMPNNYIDHVEVRWDPLPQGKVEWWGELIADLYNLTLVFHLSEDEKIEMKCYYDRHYYHVEYFKYSNQKTGEEISYK